MNLDHTPYRPILPAKRSKQHGRLVLELSIVTLLGAVLGWGLVGWGLAVYSVGKLKEARDRGYQQCLGEQDDDV